MYKRIIAFVLLLILALPVSTYALEAYDAALIYRNLQIISNHVNGVPDSDSLETIMAPGKDELLGEINKKVANNTVCFNETVVTITEVGKDEVRVEGTFKADGNDGVKNWKNDGRNYFGFKKSNNKWLLTDTDFHKALGVNKSANALSWFSLLPWLLLLVVLTGVWLFILNPAQRKAVSRRVWLIIAAIWRFCARLIRGLLARRAERKERKRVAEPEIVEETPMEFEEADEIIESAAPSPHHLEKESEVRVHHFQEDGTAMPERENKLEHKSDEKID